MICVVNMDLITTTHLLAALSPEAQQTHHPFARPTSFHSTNQPSFPIIAIAIIGILATAFLLVSYYVFVIKCCLNWHRIDILRRFSLSGHNSTAADDLLSSPNAAAAANHSPTRSRGLDSAAIRSIPIIQYKESVTAAECAVCLGEYRDGDKLRLIPDCLHAFHIDCIDVWLQTAANCPLCRAAVSAPPHPPPIIKIPSLSPSPLPPSPRGEYVVIELTAGVSDTASTSAGAGVGRGRKAVRKMSMGDELIGLRRDKDERFSVEPIRRSFSMDSSADRKMFLDIQDAVRQHSVAGVSPTAAGGGSRSVRRSFFSFGSNGSRASSRSCSAVLPVSLDP